jgi:hypothetical protein
MYVLDLMSCCMDHGMLCAAGLVRAEIRDPRFGSRASYPCRVSCSDLSSVIKHCVVTPTMTRAALLSSIATMTLGPATRRYTSRSVSSMVRSRDTNINRALPVVHGGSCLQASSRSGLSTPRTILRPYSTTGSSSTSSSSSSVWDVEPVELKYDLTEPPKVTAPGQSLVICHGLLWVVL